MLIHRFAEALLSEANDMFATLKKRGKKFVSEALIPLLKGHYFRERETSTVVCVTSQPQISRGFGEGSSRIRRPHYDQTKNIKHEEEPEQQQPQQRHHQQPQRQDFLRLLDYFLSSVSTKDLDLFRIVLLWTSWIGFRVADDVTVAPPEVGTTPTHQRSAKAAAIGDSDRPELTHLANDNSAKKLSSSTKKLEEERGDEGEKYREFAREILRDSFLDLSVSQRQQQTTSALQAAFRKK